MNFQFVSLIGYDELLTGLAEGSILAPPKYFKCLESLRNQDKPEGSPSGLSETGEPNVLKNSVSGSRYYNMLFETSANKFLWGGGEEAFSLRPKKAIKHVVRTEKQISPNFYKGKAIICDILILFG